MLFVFFFLSFFFLFYIILFASIFLDLKIPGTCLLAFSLHSAETANLHALLCCLAGLYALGKESLLLELAMEFKTWVEVSYERMETLKALELPDVFTTDPGAGRIRVLEQSAICTATLNQWNKEQPTLAILPTSRPLVSFHPNLHVVPYSDHSSYQELEDFVSALKPTSLIPIVGNYVPGSLSALVPNRKRHEILVPESVQHYMLRQPENQVSPSAYSSLCRRHFRALSPKGVVFESPVRGSRKSCEEAWEAECLEQDVSEDEMDTESSEKDSDCILIDLSQDFPSNKHRQRDGDMWSLNIVKTVSEDMVMGETEPLSLLTQRNFAPVEILRNTKAYLKSVKTTRRPFEASTKMINKTASDDNSSQHSRQGNAPNSHTLSYDDSLSEHSGHGNDQDIMSNGKKTSHHNGQGTRQNNSVTLLQSSLQNISVTSCCSATVLRHEYVERLENSILNDLPFTEEDLKPCGLRVL